MKGNKINLLSPKRMIQEAVKDIKIEYYMKIIKIISYKESYSLKIQSRVNLKIKHYQIRSL